MLSPAEPKRRQPRNAALRKPVEVLISNKTFLLPLTDIASNSDFKVLNVSKRVRVLKPKVQQMEHWSLGLSALSSPINSTSDNTARDLDATRASLIP